METKTKERKPMAALDMLTGVITEARASVEPSATDVLKQFVLASEQARIAEKQLKYLKPIVENIREAAGGAKRTEFDGSFRNKKGQYVINHIETGQDRARVEVIKGWLEARVITQKQYDEAVYFSDATHNRVAFSAGTKG